MLGFGAISDLAISDIGARSFKRVSSGVKKLAKYILPLRPAQEARKLEQRKVELSATRRRYLQERDGIWEEIPGLSEDTEAYTERLKRLAELLSAIEAIDGRVKRISKRVASKKAQVNEVVKQTIKKQKKEEEAILLLLMQ